MAILAASAVTSFLCVGQAAAQDRWTGLTADVFVGTTTESSSSDDQYFDNVEPTGTIYGLGGSYRTVLFGDLVVGVEASAATGNVQDSFHETTCTVSVCGYNEKITFTVKSSYSGRLGVSVGHEFGRHLLVSGVVGIELRDRGIFTEIESDGDDFAYDQTWVAAGPYFGLRAEYALTDRITIGAEWTRSDVVQSIIEFDDGESYEDSAEFTQGRLILRTRF